MNASQRPLCLITGSTRGLGAATALLAAKAGWDVAVHGTQLSQASLDVVHQARAHGAMAEAFAADVAVDAEVVELFKAMDRHFGHGRLRALVNNAGIVDVIARVDEMDGARLQRMFAVNVFGTFACSREALRRMSTSHGGSGGVVINVSSAASRIGSPAQYVDYAASKGAIDTFTIGLSKEVAGEGVRVNAVRPGIIKTDIHASGGQPYKAALSAPSIPMQRAGEAHEVATAILWLMSKEASYTTGAILDVSGGR